jgi:hypothetical protein
LKCYYKNGRKVRLTKTKKQTKAAIILQTVKDNQQTNNQHIELPPKLNEDRNDTVTLKAIPTSETSYWPPEELDDLFPIIPSIQKDGTLDEDYFQENMKRLFGSVSKKVSPSRPVTSRHIRQLMELKKKVPQDDRPFIDSWIVLFGLHETKEGKRIHLYYNYYGDNTKFPVSVDTAVQSSDDFLSFLETFLQDISQSVITFDKNIFEAKMCNYLGEVNDELKPTRPVTNVHIDLLKSIRNCVNDSLKRPITHWITVLKLHLHESPSSTSSTAGTYSEYDTNICKYICASEL